MPLAKLGDPGLTLTDPTCLRGCQGDDPAECAPRFGHLIAERHRIASHRFVQPRALAYEKYQAELTDCITLFPHYRSSPIRVSSPSIAPCPRSKPAARNLGAQGTRVYVRLRRREPVTTTPSGVYLSFTIIEPKACVDRFVLARIRQISCRYIIRYLILQV